MPILVVASVLLVAFAVISFLICCFYRRWKRKIHSKHPGGAAEDEDPFRIQRFKYRQLKRATKCFSPNQKLGKGGFGVVYRGLLNDGKEVAVKKLDRLSLQGEREFQNELLICSGLDSPYVVSLLGYCTHGKKARLLVYECMQNRSLQEALFEKGYPEPLDWGKRFKIIANTAKALEFLHVGCNPPIIHGDVKPSNILLDSNFSARIADFGLARFKTEQFGSESARYSVSSERLRPETPERFRFGTSDYVAPGTPEMSRSSTTRNLFPDGSHIAVEPEHVRGNKVLSKEGSFAFALDILPDMGTCKSDDAVNNEALSCSPARSQITDQTGKAQPLVDAADMPMSSANDRISPQKSDTQKSAWASTPDLSVEVGEAVDNLSGEIQSQTCYKDLSPKKGSDNGMWENRDDSEQLGGKEYVLDWLGSELPANGQDPGNVQGNATVSLDQKSSSIHGKKSRLGLEESQKEEAKKEKKKVKCTCKKGREWWKDEYFAELSGKTGNNITPRKKYMQNKSMENWKDYLSAELSSFSGELRASPRSAKFSGRCSSKEWSRNGRIGESNLHAAMERQRVPSFMSEAGSEDRKYHFSAELYNGQWSGELTKSGELVSKDVSSTTSMRGTVCYVAPEYGGTGILSEKSDIYSFGVLMLVILSGRRPIQVTAAPMKEFERANLISWARSLSQCGRLLDLMDARLEGEYDREEALLCITLALLCLQRVPASRPHISEIVKILSREMAVPNLPLELSPSPPARIPYKLPSWSPKEHQPLAATP